MTASALVAQEATVASRRARRAALAIGWRIAPMSFVLGVAFGAYAVVAGLPAVATVVMSAAMFAGGAQFAVVSLATAGAGLLAAAATAMLLNGRYVVMGISIAGALRGPWWRRLAESATLNDPSWVAALREDGSVDRTTLLLSAVGQYVAWVGGTWLGALLGPRIGSIEAVGLDAVMPMFFASLLIADLRLRPPSSRQRALTVAIVAGIVALALSPIAPAGVPALAAAGAVLVGRRGGAR